VAFEGLSDRCRSIRKSGKGKITEEDVKTAMREVRMALLEADVNYKVVKSFIATVSERAVGQEVLHSVTPGQQVVKIVYDEMTGLMGGTETKLLMSSKPPTVIMAVGLQGAGKTTTVAKLSKTLLNGPRPSWWPATLPSALLSSFKSWGAGRVPVFSMGQGSVNMPGFMSMPAATTAMW
jgi:signal recognition particle subunit SRP54